MAAGAAGNAPCRPASRGYCTASRFESPPKAHLAPWRWPRATDAGCAPPARPACSFAGGSFRDRVRRGEVEKINLSEQITVRQDKSNQSHTAGFEVRWTAGPGWRPHNKCWLFRLAVREHMLQMST